MYIIRISSSIIPLKILFLTQSKQVALLVFLNELDHILSLLWVSSLWFLGSGFWCLVIYVNWKTRILLLILPPPSAAPLLLPLFLLWLTLPQKVLNHILKISSSLKQFKFCKILPSSVKLYSESAKMIILYMPFHKEKQVLNLKKVQKL